MLPNPVCRIQFGAFGGKGVMEYSKEIQDEYKAEYSMVACAQKYFDLYKKSFQG